MEWFEILCDILMGLAITIPLVVALVKYVQKAVQEKNWKALVELVMNLMKEAEEKFDNGADRKEWVLGMIEASADTINYDIDLAVVSKLIDDLCAMSKIVNAPTKEKAEETVK